MLDRLFLQMLNMSFTAGYVILFVLLARLLLKKAPRIFSYSLWSVVLFRLCCPFSFESIFSLLPVQSNAIPANIGFMQLPQVDTGIPMINESINSILPEATPMGSVNPLQIWIFLGRVLWLAGIVALLIYSVVSLLKLRRRLKDAVQESGNIYSSASLTSPFVMGLFRPKIYLPASLTEQERDYILLHEQTHIKRLDHVVKIVSFFVLCLHWFNPLVWVAFFFSGRDMELSCDEAVIKKLGSNVKKDYSTSLLSLATGRRIVGGTPLAFGEGDTKSRIQNVLNYKKPAFWVIVVSVIAVVAVGVGLMANPKEEMIGEPYGFAGVHATILKIDVEGQTMVLEGTDQNSAIGDRCILDWSNANLQIVEADGSIKSLSINDFAAGDYVVLFVDEIQETYPTRAKASAVQLQGEAPLNAMRPMVMVDGVLYLDTGKEVAKKVANSAVLGEITSAASASEKPTKNGQCNFNSGVGAKYAAYDDGMAVFLDHKWFFFEKEADDTISAAYTMMKLGKNGKVLAENTPETQELAKEIVMDGMVKSAAWEGVDVGTLEECYLIRQNFAEAGETHDYYAYRLTDGTSVLQNGTDGRYSILSGDLYEKLEKDVFFPATALDVQPENINYLQSLTAEELKQTEEVVRAYFTDEAPYYEGVVSIEPMPNESVLYQNTGMEAEYAPGNIIIYKVLTGRDRRDKTPERSASVSRTSKDAPWELINQGY